MAKIRQVILFAGAPSGGGAAPLGNKREILKSLAPLNTAPDGSKDDSLAYGPGLIIQFPFVDARDDINQLLVSINEEEIAWAVLQRICKHTGWKMMDPESGRTFGS